MSDYILKLEKHGISSERYNELKYLCLQYDDKRRELRAILHTSGGSFGVDGRAVGSVGNPTLRKVIRREMLLCDCEDIEQAAIAAAGGDGVMYQHLLRHVVAKRKPPIDTIPCGKNQFYDMRKRFFIILDEKRGKLPS